MFLTRENCKKKGGKMETTKKILGELEGCPHIFLSSETAKVNIDLHEI